MWRPRHYTLPMQVARDDQKPASTSTSESCVDGGQVLLIVLMLLCQFSSQCGKKKLFSQWVNLNQSITRVKDECDELAYGAMTDKHVRVCFQYGSECFG